MLTSSRELLFDVILQPFEIKLHYPLICLCHHALANVVPQQVLLVRQVLGPLSRSNIWPSSECGYTIFRRWICFCMQWAAVKEFQHHRWSRTPPHSCPNFVYALLPHKLRKIVASYSFEIKHSRILFSGDYSPRKMLMSE